ncbi:hypothetical protein GGI02_001253 [Coemansia sp. RSA 2322]|nr:hypothetical protein GGI02_001253 [Coemansia sp. RSA 2322]
MFNSLNATGGAGQIARDVPSNANTGLYCAFVVFGLLGGSIVNLCGIRWTIFVSGLTYSLYSASFIYLNHTSSGTFTIVAGPILGIGAGVLWAAQGMAMMSYPVEGHKGQYISIFWAIFNLGGVIGGIVPFVANYYQGDGSQVAPLSDAGYIAFVVLEAAGATCALLLAPPERVIRNDGSYVAMLRHTSWNAFNGSLFTVRTRGLNSMLYWASQMIAAYAISLLHDCRSVNRRRRSILSLATIVVLANVMWGCTLVYQVRYTHGPLATGESTDYPHGLIDFTQSQRAAGPMVLFCFMGIVDALWQSFAYWIIGTITNDSQMLARYAGYYKGMQSLGAAIAWQLDARSVPLIAQLAANWVLLDVAVPLMLYVAMHVKDSSNEATCPPTGKHCAKDYSQIEML